MKSEGVWVVRHLEDEKDLRYRFNPPLKPISQRDVAVLRQNALSVSRELLEKKRDILIISSSRVRSFDSAAKLAKEIRDKVPKNTSIKIRLDTRIQDFSHGTLLLPERYKAGDSVPCIGDAWKIFWEESLCEKKGLRNIDYRYGDPVVSGTTKYPELHAGFAKPGESLREIMLRHLSAALNYLENPHVSDKPLILIVGHSISLAILAGISQACTRSEPFSPGDLTDFCARRLMSREGRYQIKDEATNLFVDQNPEKLKTLLCNEINYLSSTKK